MSLSINYYQTDTKINESWMEIQTTLLVAEDDDADHIPCRRYTALRSTEESYLPINPSRLTIGIVNPSNQKEYEDIFVLWIVQRDIIIQLLC